jgi:coenzyme Q-binding protein COQ10
MSSHSEKRILPYTAKQMFDLVADVERYPEFLPWCTAARIVSRQGNRFNADVSVGYGFLQESFNSTVVATPHTRIDIEYQNGPFRHLVNNWQFADLPASGGIPQCEITFFIDFEFRSTLLAATIGSIFEEAVRSMIHAFEQRAKAIYAP